MVRVRELPHIQPTPAKEGQSPGEGTPTWVGLPHLLDKLHSWLPQMPQAQPLEIKNSRDFLHFLPQLQGNAER